MAGIGCFSIKDTEYGQRNATNTLKRFLTGQFVKCFLLISPSNASKHL